MTAFWDGLPSVVQDLLFALLLITPLAIIAGILWRGFAPWPLIRALLTRFRWANAIFVALIALSVGMGIGLIAQERGLRHGMAQSADKFDLVIGAPGSELTLMLATVFLQPSDVGLIDGFTFNEIAENPRIQIAAPVAFGDSFQDAPIIGTTVEFVDFLSNGQVEGRMFAKSGEAVIGALAPLSVGDRFEPAHGIGDAREDGAHEGAEFVVVGRLARSGTPWDRAVLVPVETVWEVHGLANGHAPDAGDRIGPPFDAKYFPGTPAVIVRADSLISAYALRSEFSREAETMAFFPGAVLATLYRIMGDIREVMSILTLVTQALVAASVLLGLFILTRLFSRRIAMLRALGAPGRFVVCAVWSYGTLLLTAGTALGMALGFVSAFLISWIVTARTDVLVKATLGWPETHLALSFLAVTSVVALAPALALLRQPIVPNLRS